MTVFPLEEPGHKGGTHELESDLLDLTGIDPDVIMELPESAFGLALRRALDPENTETDLYAGFQSFIGRPSRDKHSDV